MRDPITDPLARALWRDYRVICRSGNPLGVSFVEYVAARVQAMHPQTFTTSSSTPWYVATCGHQHPWGESCATETMA